MISFINRFSVSYLNNLPGLFVLFKINKQAMKKLSISTFAVIALMAVTSCSKIADVLTVDVPTDVSVDLKIPAGSSELKSSGTKAFDVSEILDIDTNPKVIEYQAKIKEIAAKGGKVSVTQGGSQIPASIKNAVLKITNLDTNVVLGSWSLDASVFLTGAAVTIGAPTSGSFADISAALDKKSKVEVRVTGNTDLLTEFIFTLTLQTVVKAKVL
jgi:hypothetical protein